MKQTKNPNTQFKIQIGEKGKSWKTNLWIVVHGGFDLFPSSGELFFFEIVLLRQSMWRWWGLAWRKRGSRGMAWTGDLYGGDGGSAWRKFFVSVKEAEEWCESFWGFSIFWRERFWLFGEGLLLGAFFSWHGVV